MLRRFHIDYPTRHRSAWGSRVPADRFKSCMRLLKRSRWRGTAGQLMQEMLFCVYEDHWLNLTRKHPLTPAKSPGPLALAWVIGNPLDPKPRYLGVLVLLTAYAMAIHDSPAIVAKQTRDRILVD